MGILSSLTAAPATEAIVEVMALVGIVTMITRAPVIPWKLDLRLLQTLRVRLNSHYGLPPLLQCSR